MKKTLAALLALTTLLASVSGCCVASGYQRAACRDACEKAETQQRVACGSMTGEAKTTCDAQTKTTHDTCMQACEH